MVAVVRLYRQHDMDLLTIFYGNHDIQFGRLLKKTIIAYVNDLPMPNLDFKEPADTSGYVPKSVCLHLTFSENKPLEKPVCDLLSQMKSGYRCSFIKALFRNCCAYLPMAGYTNGSKFQMARKRCAISIAGESINTSKLTEDKTDDSVKQKESIGATESNDSVATPIKTESKPNKIKFESVPEPEVNKSDNTDLNNNSDDSLDDLFASFSKIG